MTTLQRLLRHPHAAVFDKGPGGELALRISHPAGATWVVAEEILRVTVGATTWSYNLVEYTFSALSARLQSDGFEVPSLSSEWSGRAAVALAEGSGAQFSNNGDHLHAFTSLLWVLLSGYAGEVKAAEQQVAEALRQMVIPQAEGEWLDLWGQLYAVPRLVGEADDSYAARIPREAFRLRVNARAIELAIRDATGYDVRIEENWQSIFTLDQSLLSGPDRLYDGEEVGYHLIKPVARVSVDWPAVLAVINRNRAAGVLVTTGSVIRGSSVDGTSGHSVTGDVKRRHVRMLPYEDRVFLDFMQIEDVPVLNYACSHLRNIKHLSYAAVPTLSWDDVPWLPVTWDAPTYIVYTQHTRTYRVYYISARYSSRYWRDERSWSESAGRSWEAAPIIFTGHASTS